jgi:hypothetical protein
LGDRLVRKQGAVLRYYSTPLLLLGLDYYPGHFLGPYWWAQATWATHTHPGGETIHSPGRSQDPRKLRKHPTHTHTHPHMHNIDDNPLRLPIRPAERRAARDLRKSGAWKKNWQRWTRSCATSDQTLSAAARIATVRQCVSL